MYYVDDAGKVTEIESEVQDGIGGIGMGADDGLHRLDASVRIRKN